MVHHEADAADEDAEPRGHDDHGDDVVPGVEGVHLVHELLEVEAVGDVLAVAVEAEREHLHAAEVRVVARPHADLRREAPELRDVLRREGDVAAAEPVALRVTEALHLAVVDAADRAVFQQQEVARVGVAVEEAVDEELVAVDGAERRHDARGVEVAEEGRRVGR